MKTTLQPQNVEAEQFLLSAILLDPDSLLIASDIIDPSDFYREQHRQIFEASLDIYQLGESLDLLTLAERLRVKNRLDQAGGVGYLSMLAALSPTSANARYHAKLIKEKSILRRVKLWASGLSARADEGIEDIRHWVAEIERDLVDLAQMVREKRSPFVSGIVRDILSGWTESRPGEKYIPTDEKFNSLIPGYFPKHFFMIGGYTSNGKSSLLNQIVADVCTAGARPLIFSLEDSREEKVMKLISNISDIRQMKLIQGDITGHEEEIKEAAEVVKGWNPIVYDDVYSIEEICLKAKKHKIQDGINMVCIDYVQNIHSTGDLYADMRLASIQLDRMKKDLNVTVIALSQVTNEAVKTNSELIALKGAGELAAAADIVLWLKRVKGEGRERWLDCEVRKNRPFGPTGIAPLMFSDNWTRVERRGF